LEVILPDYDNLKPLPIHGLSDYHCHCDYSVDAQGSIHDYCLAALQRNLAEICFTTHYDSNPNSVGGQVSDNFIRVDGTLKPVSPDRLERYVEDVRRAHEDFYPLGLSVRLGLEFGWFPGCEESAAGLKEQYGFEYFLAGVHEIEDICYCCSDQYERCFSRYSAQEMAEKYYGEVYAAVRSGLFDTIAHLDYYRKYGEKYYGPEIGEVHEPYIDGLLALLKETGTTIELNTAAVRKGLREYYPSAAIINAARRANIEIHRLGSDAHSPEHVGFEFEMAAMIAPPFLAGCDD
jgi:histidinol-phosphatase (PHP family)